MDSVRLSIEDRIALITLDRPAKRNALDRAMVEGLGKACRDIEHSAARVTILTGAGDKSFSAGGDIAAWSADTAEEFGRFWVREGHLVFDALARLRQPLVAVINGDCLGGGLELRRLCGLPHRRTPCAVRPAGSRARHHSRLVRDAARGAPLWFTSGPAHGAVRRDF